MLPTTGRIELDLSSELDELAACTRLLELGEYRIFQAAYRAWFGHEPSEAELKPGFATYLCALRLPPWVRHYCRRIIAEAEAEGRLIITRRPEPGEGGPRSVGQDLALAASFGVALFAVLTLV